MLKVGLTGNVAAGKSAVARVWTELGAMIIDADQLAREAVEPGTPALQAITARWGPGVLDESGALNRAALRQIVFADPGARRELEGIVHPAVGALRDRQYKRAAERGEPIVVADIPLLFEVGLQHEFDCIVLVDAPAGVREARLVRDRGLTPDEARRMIAAQMPSAAKRDQADYIIENTGTLADLERKAAEVWGQLQQRASA